MRRARGPRAPGARASLRPAARAALRSARVVPLRRSMARVVMNSSQERPSTPKPSQTLGLKAIPATHSTTPVSTSPIGTRE
ncbi:hypothetical protein SBADM41S_02230 [Streptomyces badius]